MTDRRAAHAARVSADEAVIVAEFSAVGVPVASVYDFVGKQAVPEAVIPIMLRHLQMGHHPTVREGIIQALGIPAARSLAFDPLRRTYADERDPMMRWVIANALSGMARFEDVADLPGIAEFATLFPNGRRANRRT